MLMIELLNTSMLQVTGDTTGMERKFKQWWSTVILIATKWTATSHLISLNIKKKPWQMRLEILVLVEDRSKNLAGLNMNDTMLSLT